MLWPSIVSRFRYVFREWRIISFFSSGENIGLHFHIKNAIEAEIENDIDGGLLCRIERSPAIFLGLLPIV